MSKAPPFTAARQIHDSRKPCTFSHRESATLEQWAVAKRDTGAKPPRKVIWVDATGRRLAFGVVERKTKQAQHLDGILHRGETQLLRNLIAQLFRPDHLHPRPLPHHTHHQLPR